jgi:L,D-peptidoglycan transpeptidase YkuD (ErfK/YbiS/YcfS/YnhG family)
MHFTPLLILVAIVAGAPAADFAPPRGCEQVVLVISPSWSSASATLQRYTLDHRDAVWKKTGPAMAAIIGERGLAWGRGLHSLPNEGELRKVEGDRRAPAGIFGFGEAFGRRKITGLKLPYRPITPDLEAVDDPASRHYNQLVERTRVARPDWRSSEKMAAIAAYKLGLVVAHNSERRRGAGSCIFIHLRVPGDQGTAGCTALREADLVTLLRWLDPARRPVLIQLPEQVARERLPGFSL